LYCFKVNTLFYLEAMQRYAEDHASGFASSYDASGTILPKRRCAVVVWFPILVAEYIVPTATLPAIFSIHAFELALVMELSKITHKLLRHVHNADR
jgi:hypothetical protein